MSDKLLEALDELVPVPDEHGDWNSVVERAGVKRVQPRPRRPLLLAGVAAIALAIVASPAFGIGSALLDLIGRTNVPFATSKPAPNVVKKRFADLAIGAPSGMAPGAIASQARDAGTFNVGGRMRALWVVPTRRGGFCFEYEGAFGGCRATAADRTRTPLAADWSFSFRRPDKAPAFRSGSGVVTSAAITRLELVYTDGTRDDVPFVWVSKPIAAGFFVVHLEPGKQPATIVATDDAGRVVARAAAPSLRPPAFAVPRHIPSLRVPRVLPTTPAVAPAAPLQQASADGVSVVVGANGVAVFHATGVKPKAARLLTRSVSYSCFRLTHEFGIFDAQGIGNEGAFAPTAAVRINGIHPPFDGCEIEGEYGHLWPDRLGSHSAAEIPLTAAGRRFFADRAAARDLALFVRTRRVQQLREEPPAQALRDLRAAFPQLATSPIRIVPTATGLTFSETSPTGKQFTVIVSNKRIVDQNLKPYAFVF